MPISHKHKTVFMHIPKSAGTSISRWLDIAESESNYYITRYTHGNNCALQHIPYENMRSQIGSEIFDSYYKFAVVRNPWDRLVSTYKWRNGKKLYKNFKDFVEFVYGLYIKYSFEKLQEYPNFSKYFCAHFYPQYMYIPSMSNNVLSDELCEQENFDILKFENFNTDIIKVKTKLNINRPLPHLNKSFTNNYRDYYDEETKNMVEEMYKKDITLFGYIF